MELGNRLGATPTIHSFKAAGAYGDIPEKQGFHTVEEVGLGGGRAVEVGPDIGRGMPKLRIDGLVFSLLSRG